MRVSVCSCVIPAFPYKSRSQNQQTKYACAINVATRGLSVSLCSFTALYWRVYSLFFFFFLSFLSISPLFGPTAFSERFAFCKMATQAITRRKLNEHEQKISRNGLTFHEDTLANGHAGLQTNGRVQVRSSPVTRYYCYNFYFVIRYI